MSAVKCLYCEKYFDKEEEAYSKIGRRYAHYTCYLKHQDKPEDQDSISRRELTDFIKNLYYPYNPDWKMIGTQIRKYKLEGMTYNGMKLTLDFFYNVKHNKLKKEQGIGIIPYAYKDAYLYHQRLKELENKKNEIIDKQIEKKEIEETIVIPVNNVEKKLIDFNY